MPGPPEFRPPAWLRGGMAQTIWSNYAPRSGPGRAFRDAAVTHVLATDDDDRIRVHWNRIDDAPVLVIFHGLTGCASSPQVLGLADKAARLGFTVVRADLRNASGDTPSVGVGHAGRSEDAAAVIRHVSTEAAGLPIAAVGYSLGGNVLLKALGERLDAVAGLRAAVGISVPIDLDAACHAIDAPRNRVFRNYFVTRLKRIVAQRADDHPHYRDIPLADVRSIREFDGRLVATLCGFASAEDYYARSSSIRVMAGIEAPTLLIHAHDDPFIPFEPFDRPEVVDTAAIEVLPTRHGGHCGFWGRPSSDPDRFWAEHRAVEFCAARVGLAG